MASSSLKKASKTGKNERFLNASKMKKFDFGGSSFANFMRNLPLQTFLDEAKPGGGKNRLFEYRFRKRSRRSGNTKKVFLGSSAQF